MFDIQMTKLNSLTDESGCSSVAERQLPKLDVEGSTPFSRSILF